MSDTINRRCGFGVVDGTAGGPSGDAEDRTTLDAYDAAGNVTEQTAVVGRFRSYNLANSVAIVVAHAWGRAADATDAFTIGRASTMPGP